MSYERVPPGANADLTDATPNRNSELVAPHPKVAKLGVAIKPGKRCHSCGTQYNRGRLCPNCGSPSYRAFEVDDTVDLMPSNVSAHLRRSIQGRAATDAEIDAARNGKIETLPSRWAGESNARVAGELIASP